MGRNIMSNQVDNKSVVKDESHDVVTHGRDESLDDVLMFFIESWTPIYQMSTKIK